MSAVPYRVRRSARARRARVLVRPEGAVEVVLPHGLPPSEAGRLVEERGGWIERTLRRMREAEAELPPARLADGGEVPYLGERLPLRVLVEPGRARPLVARRAADAGATGSRSGWPAREASEAGAPGGPGRGRGGPDKARDGPDGARDGLEVRVARPGPEAVRDALESWYRARAREEVRPRLDAAAARAGVRYARLQIRGQRTRWASCSPRGAMSFNWRLLLAPAEMLDYVVEHEVAHLEVPDHSERFWALLGSRCPEWRERERWLRRHGHALRL